jgi:prepilin-type N-terminal cleavage/methylation domain-containing protein
MKTQNGFTLIELLIVVAIGGIGLAMIVGAVTGNTVLPSKASCIAGGGKWTEGIQYGRMTQLCAYN